MIRSSIYITLLTLGNGLLGFAIQMLLAKNFGVGVEIDTYLFSLSIPIFVAAIISSIMNYTSVPVIAKIKNDPDRFEKYINSLILFVTLLAIFILVMIGYLAEAQQLLIDYSYVDNNIGEIIKIAWIVCALQIFQGALISIFNGMQRHKYAIILVSFQSIGVILILIFSYQFVSVILVLFGMMLGLFFSIVLGVYIINRDFLKISLMNADWFTTKKMILSSPSTAIALSCFGIYAVIDAIWAVKFGSGTLSILGYSQRILIGLGNLAIIGPFTILVPKFSSLVYEKKYKDFMRLLISSSAIITIIALFISVIIFFFSREIVEIIYMRGAFSSSDVSSVSNTIIYMLPGMVTMLVSAFMLRALFCIDNVSIYTTTLGISWGVIYFILSSFLYKDGSVGLAIAYSSAWSLYFVSISALFLWLYKNKKITALN
jgi:putative peptidoglycan lipid II flippase